MRSISPAIHTTNDTQIENQRLLTRPASDAHGIEIKVPLIKGGVVISNFCLGENSFPGGEYGGKCDNIGGKTDATPDSKETNIMRSTRVYILKSVNAFIMLTYPVWYSSPSLLWPASIESR